MAPLSCKTPLPIDTHLSTITAAVRDSRRLVLVAEPGAGKTTRVDRKSTRLNSSHGYNSYAVFCLKKKNTALGLAAITTAGCSSISLPSAPSIPWFSSAPKADLSAEGLFEEGTRAFNEKKYVRAIDNFSKLRTDNPFSPLVTQAELKMADAYYFFFQDTATTEIYTLSLHDALPIWAGVTAGAVSIDPRVERVTIAEIERLVPEVVSTYFNDHNFGVARNPKVDVRIDDARHFRSEEHTSELQSRLHLVCRLLLEKKKK